MCPLACLLVCLLGQRAWIRWTFCVKERIRVEQIKKEDRRGKGEKNVWKKEEENVWKKEEENVWKKEEENVWK